jgi:tetratricopeptide (TPR) repeat protein
MKTPRSLLAATAAFVLLTTSHAQSAASLDAARAALQAGDLPKAESLLVPLTGSDAKDAAAFHVLGQLRERQRNLKDAATAYEQAAKLDATKPEYHSALGIAIGQRMGELNFMQQAMAAGKMKKAFETSVAIDPHHVSGLIGLSRYYANAPEIAGGSLEKARTFAAQVKAIVPHLGEAEYANIADHATALAHYEAALQLQPGNAGFSYATGRMLAKLGRKDEARARFEETLRLNPDFEPAKRALAALDQPAG